MASRVIASSRRACNNGVSPALRAMVRHPPACFLPSITLATGSAAASLPLRSSQLAANTLHTSAALSNDLSLSERSKGRKVPFNEKKNILVNHNRLMNEGRKIEKWDSEQKDNSAKEDLPVGWNKRRVKHLTAAQLRADPEARQARQRGQKVSIDPDKVETSFRLKVKELTDYMKKRYDEIKKMKGQEAEEHLAQSWAHMRIALRLLRILLRGRDPKTDDYDQACINAARLRTPYITLIAMAMQIGKVELAYHHFSSMKKQGVAPSGPAFNVLLHGLVKNELLKYRHSAKNPPFKAAGKALKHAHDTFAELELLAHLAFPTHFPWTFGPHSETREGMIREMKKHPGTDSKRMRVLSKHSTVHELRAHPGLLASPINVYVRILLIAGEWDKAWKLFERMCTGVPLWQKPRPGLVIRELDKPRVPLADRILFTTMISGVPEVRVDPKTGELDEAARTHLQQIRAIWSHWERKLDWIKSVAELQPLRSEPKPEEEVHLSDTKAFMLNNDLDPDDVGPSPDEVDLHSVLRTDGELEKLIPDPSAISQLITKLGPDRRHDAAFLKALLRKCCGLTSGGKEADEVICLDPNTNDLTLAPDAPKAPSKALVELTPQLADATVRAFATLPTAATCIHYFNQILVASLARRSANPSADEGPLGPLISARGLMSPIYAMGCLNDPIGAMRLLRVADRDTFVPPADVYARVIRTIAFSSIEDSRKMGGLTAREMQKKGKDALKPYEDARDVFALYSRRRLHLDAAQDTPQWGLRLVRMVHVLLVICNKASIEGHIPARSREALDLIEKAMPLKELVEKVLPLVQPASSSSEEAVSETEATSDESSDASAPVPQKSTPISNGWLITQYNGVLSMQKMLEELHVALSSAIMPNFAKDEARPSEDKLALWREVRSSVSKFKPEKEKRYEEKRWNEEKRWFQRGVGGGSPSGGGGGGGGGGRSSSRVDGEVERKAGGADGANHNNDGPKSTGVRLRLSNEDLKDLENLHSQEVEGGREEESFDDADVDKRRAKSKRGTAMEKELERWVRG